MERKQNKASNGSYLKIQADAHPNSDPPSEAVEGQENMPSQTHVFGIRITLSSLFLRNNKHRRIYENRIVVALW